MADMVCKKGERHGPFLVDPMVGSPRLMSRSHVSHSHRAPVGFAARCWGLGCTKRKASIATELWTL